MSSPASLITLVEISGELTSAGIADTSVLIWGNPTDTGKSGIAGIWVTERDGQCGRSRVIVDTSLLAESETARVGGVRDGNGGSHQRPRPLIMAT